MATNYNKKFNSSTKVFSNLEQEVVEITVDKIKLILSAYLSKVRQAQEWGTALGISLTILATLLTASFKDFIGIKSDVWNALFILVMLLCIYWLIKSLYTLFRLKSFLDLIEEIKSGSDETS